MASTITVNDGIVFCSAYINQQSLLVNNMQPAIGAAQIIINRILGAPCVWRFNRANFSIPISRAGGVDYQVTIPDLGSIEQQWLDDAGNITELNGDISLAKGSGAKRPTQVSPQYDDNAGNLTFRFNALPDKNYTAYFDYQRKAPLITGPAQPLPIPDEHADLFYVGLLGWAGMLVRDSRFPIWQNEFISLLLARQDGLDDQAKAILLGDWMSALKTITRNTSSVQAGVAGRGH